jgi:hypothetical protein
VLQSSNCFIDVVLGLPQRHQGRGAFADRGGNVRCCELLQIELDHHVFGDLPLFGGPILEVVKAPLHVGDTALEASWAERAADQLDLWRALHALEVGELKLSHIEIALGGCASLIISNRLQSCFDDLAVVLMKIVDETLIPAANFFSPMSCDLLPTFRVPVNLGNRRTTKDYLILKPVVAPINEFRGIDGGLEDERIGAAGRMYAGKPARDVMQCCPGEPLHCLCWVAVGHSSIDCHRARQRD